MMRSPTHESYCIFGKSLVFSTDSDKKTWVNGKEHKHVTGSCEVKIGDFTSETFVGAKHSQQLAATYDAFIGLKVSTSMAVDISANKDYKAFKDKKVDRDASVHVHEKAPEILYAAGGCTVKLLKDKSATMWGGTDNKVQINASSGDITIESGKGKISLKATKEMDISGSGVDINAGSKPIKMKGSNVSMKGDKIELG
jgi:uncharacterized protein (DUF2345 family)